MKIIKYIVFLVCFVTTYMFVEVQLSDGGWGLPVFYKALVIGSIITVGMVIMDVRKAKKDKEKKI